MRLAFFSNYLNEHQLPLCHALAGTPGVDFTFVAQSEGGNTGRTCLNDSHPFVLREYVGEDERKAAMELAAHADVVLFGHMGGNEGYVRTRL